MNRQDIPKWIPFTIFTGAVLVLFFPLILGDRVLFWGLPTLQFFPWRNFAFDELASGRVPFWNPYSGGGAPLLANYQTALFYPPNWLYALGNRAHMMSLVAVLHILWGGLGMWMFTGQLQIRTFGRSVSAFAFALGGYSIARMGSFPTANAVAWLPFLFWAVHRLMQQRGALNTGFLGTITAMLLLTGHAQTAFYALLAAGAFAAWLALWGQPERSRQYKLTWLAMALMGVLLGVGVASSQLLFTAELLRESQRSGGVDYDTLTNLSFAPLRLINFLMPNFFGSPADGSYLTPDGGVYFEDAVYIGLLPLIAAIAAIRGWVNRRNLLDYWPSFRTVPFWSLLGLVGFVLATGKFGPVYRFLFDYVPTFDAFREPVRWMLLPTFALAVLAGIGVENWGRTNRVFYWSRLFSAGGAGMALLALGFRQFGSIDEDFMDVLTGAIIAFGSLLVGAGVLTLSQPDEDTGGNKRWWQAAVLVFICMDLAWAANGLNPTVPNQYYRDLSLNEPQGRLYWYEEYEEAVLFDNYFTLYDYRPARRNWPELRRTLLPNLSMVDGIQTFNNFDPLIPRYHNMYKEMIEANPTEARLLQAAGIGQVYGEHIPQGWRTIQSNVPSAVAPDEPSLAWVVPEAIWLDDNEAIREYMLSAAWNPQETAAIYGEPVEPTTPAGTGSVEFFEMLRSNPQEIRFRVVTDGGGYLVLANTWYPGWEVSVDGRSQKLYRANLSFMAVALPDGDAEVTFQYLPTINLLSIFVSFISISICLGFIAVGLFRQID